MLAQTDWWTVSAQWATFIAAAVYTGFTIRLFNETKRMREAQTEPSIAISLVPVARTPDPATTCFVLCIENVGPGWALEVSAFPTDMKGVKAASVPGCLTSIFGPTHSVAIGGLAPGSRREIWIGEGAKLRDGRTGGVDGVAVRYRGATGKVGVTAALGMNEVVAYESSDMSKLDFARLVSHMATIEHQLGAISGAIRVLDQGVRQAAMRR